MPRINLDSLAAPAQRQTVDANWSPRKKKVVSVLAVVGGVAALSFGTWKAWSMMAPGLPTSAKEAVAVINSSRFENLDDIRKQQYLQEADRLLRQTPFENRGDLWKDPKYREAMGKIREERLDEMAIRFARGEEPEPRGDDRPQLTEEQRAEMRKQWEQMRKEQEDREAKMTEEEKAAERAKREAEMRKMMDQRIGQSINTGNAQSMGLRAEMFQRRGGWGGMRGNRPGGGGGRPGGGGGGGGGRPGGGGGPR